MLIQADLVGDDGMQWHSPVVAEDFFSAKQVALKQAREEGWISGGHAEVFTTLLARQYQPGTLTLQPWLDWIGTGVK